MQQLVATLALLGCVLLASCGGSGGSGTATLVAPVAVHPAVKPTQQAAATPKPTSKPSVTPSATPAAAPLVVLPSPASPTAYGTLVGTGNPLAYYRLSDSGSTMLDSGPNRLNGTYGANVTHASAALTSAQDPASVFPGGGPGGNVPSNAGSVPANAVFGAATTGVTVEAWIKLNDYNRTNNFISIVSYGREIIGSVWALQVSPQSGLDFYIKVNATPSSYLLRAPVLVPGQAYHAVGTYDGANAKLYLNGILEASVPASGTLNVAGLAPQWGLAIGGALGGSLPAFNGAINDVAIYPTALVPAVIENHYLVGHIVPTLTETPAGSDRFVDSIGVVTHLRTTGGPYTNSWPTFQTLIEASGIRHIGDTLIANPSWYPQHINALASAGIHASLITSPGQTAQDISTAIPAFAPAIEAVQGLNEPDLGGDPTWVADTQAFQQMLWSTVKGTATTATLPVVGPSVTSVANEVALGDLSSYLDEGSMHDYFDGYNPGTTGWGSLSAYGIYGSLAYDLAIGAIVSGSKPIMSTEFGYSTSLGDVGGVDSQTLARYVPRAYLEHFLHGVVRSTIYEFYDEGRNPSANFGLVTAANTPKSSYYAIQSLIGALADPGSSFAPKPLTYQLGGNLSNVAHLLLQKRDGTYELALWIETPSFDPNAQTDIAVAPQTVTLAPEYAPQRSDIATIGDTGKLASRALAFSGGMATFAIDDHVTIVSFK